MLRTYNLQLAHDSTFIIAGPSNSGKTEWTLRLLRERGELFDKKHMRLMWCHGTQLKESEEQRIRTAWGDNSSVHFLRGFSEQLVDVLRPYDLVVVDDLQSEVARSPAFTSMFTKLAHHTPLTCVYLCQNLFQRSDPEARTRSLSASYICLTRSVRDRTSIRHLSQQMFPQENKFLVRAYEDATDNKPYSYLFIDLRQETPDFLRFRTGIFPGDKHMVYMRTMDTSLPDLISNKYDVGQQQSGLLQ